MGPKALELLAEELAPEHVSEVSLLSGPANVTTRVKNRFERFAAELANNGVRA